MAIVLQAGGKPGRDTFFPVAKNQADWKRTEKKLAGIDRRWLDQIASMQPFQRPEPPSHQELVQLNEFNNYNKHRLLPMTKVLSRVTAHYSPGAQFEEEIFDGPVEEGRVQVRVRSRGEPFSLQVRLEGFRIVIIDESDYIWDLANILKWVEQSVEAFAPAFPPPPSPEASA